MNARPLITRAVLLGAAVCVVPLAATLGAQATPARCAEASVPSVPLTGVGSGSRRLNDRVQAAYFTSQYGEADARRTRLDAVVLLRGRPGWANGGYIGDLRRPEATAGLRQLSLTTVGNLVVQHERRSHRLWVDDLEVPLQGCMVVLLDHVGVDGEAVRVVEILDGMPWIPGARGMPGWDEMLEAALVSDPRVAAFVGGPASVTPGSR